MTIEDLAAHRAYPEVIFDKLITFDQKAVGELDDARIGRAAAMTVGRDGRWHIEQAPSTEYLETKYDEDVKTSRK